MAKHPDFCEVVDFYTKYDQQFQFYCKSFTSAIVSLSSKTRRRFTKKKKEEVRLYYSISGNFAETGKVFDINSARNDQSSSSTG